MINNSTVVECSVTVSVNLTPFDFPQRTMLFMRVASFPFCPFQTLQRFVQPFVDARNEAARKEGDRQFQVSGDVHTVWAGELTPNRFTGCSIPAHPS